MTEIRVNALVVKESASGEYDKILTVLSEKYGKLYVVGKGVKSVRSRHMASTQLFTYASFSLRKKGNYYYITDSDLIENYYDIRDTSSKMYQVVSTFYNKLTTNLKSVDIYKSDANGNKVKTTINLNTIRIYVYDILNNFLN
ncbi:MAG: DNA repair protein RecO [Clostridia bacterium]|nr:DNA repair protein RecO [Clostridia bacterium]